MAVTDVVFEQQQQDHRDAQDDADGAGEEAVRDGEVHEAEGQPQDHEGTDGHAAVAPEHCLDARLHAGARVVQGGRIACAVGHLVSGWNRNRWMPLGTDYESNKGCLSVGGSYFDGAMKKGRGAQNPVRVASRGQTGRGSAASEAGDPVGAGQRHAGHRRGLQVSATRSSRSRWCTFCLPQARAIVVSSMFSVLR
jgi:hypothetical protein